jgi:DNA helicase-2/ATP-dependent DNA helicase PcrA
MTVRAQYSPAELADALGLFTPTEAQAAVIAAPPGPLMPKPPVARWARAA